MKKLLYTFFAGALVCLGLTSCDKDENGNTLDFLRFPPVASKADRLVRMDVGTANSLGRVETVSYLFTYNDAGRLVGIDAVNAYKGSISYLSNGIQIEESDFNAYHILKDYYPDNYVVGIWSDRETSTYTFDGNSLTYKSGDYSETATLNADGTMLSDSETKCEWKDGNLIRIEDISGATDEFEFSDKLNPWCGVDVYSILLLGTPAGTALLGAAKSKNIPVKHISKYSGKTRTYTIESELDEKGRPQTVTVKEDGKLDTIAQLFYDTHDASTVHSGCDYGIFVTKQEILEEKFIPGTKSNYDFSYRYKVHTYFSNGTDEVKEWDRPSEVVNIACSRIPEAETYTFPTPQFTGMDPLTEGSEELNEKLSMSAGVPYTTERRRLRFKLDTMSDYLDITIAFVGAYNHGLVYWNGTDRILHHPYINPTIRLSDEGFKATGPSTSSRHGHSCELMNYKGKMLLDLNGNAGKDCFPFEVEINMYKLTN